MVRLAGRLRLLGATEAVGKLLESGARAVKLAVVEALMAIASPSAVRFLERGIDDAERDVRVACVKYLGFRGHRNAFPRIEAAVVGGKLRGTDLTEKIAFFEAYGALAGAVGSTLIFVRIEVGESMQACNRMAPKLVRVRASGNLGFRHGRSEHG